MSENKKIKNATKNEFNGISFKSDLEQRVYRALVKEGITPEYETHTFLLWEGFIPTVPFYTKNTFKRKNFRINVLSRTTVQDMRPLSGITYTPDFYMEYLGKKVIIEVKGFTNDVFPYKFKLFRKYLEELPDKDSYIVWEVFNIKQLTECLNDLRQSVSQ